MGSNYFSLACFVTITALYLLLSPTGARHVDDLKSDICYGTTDKEYCVFCLNSARGKAGGGPHQDRRWLGGVTINCALDHLFVVRRYFDKFASNTTGDAQKPFVSCRDHFDSAIDATIAAASRWARSNGEGTKAKMAVASDESYRCAAENYNDGSNPPDVLLHEYDISTGLVILASTTVG